MIPTINPIKNEKQEAPVERLQPAKKKKEITRRGEPPLAPLRDLEKLIDAFAEEFPFAGDKVEKLKNKTASVFEAWRRAEAGHRAEHHEVRAKLATMFNGRIERWINASADVETKAFFKKVWRD